MKGEDTIAEILKTPAELIRYLPIRVVLRKDEAGKYLGLCENSFSMSMASTRARIWWSGKAYSVIGEHIINGIEDAERNCKEGDIVINPLDESSPIEVDWHRWLSSSTKYEKRNALFKIRQIVK